MSSIREAMAVMFRGVAAGDGLSRFIKAPSLREALDRAVEQGLPYLILDGTLIASDRCADKKTSRKGKEIDKWYSGKAHRPPGNVQALAAPGGVPLWASEVRPGSTWASRPCPPSGCRAQPRRFLPGRHLISSFCEHAERNIRAVASHARKAQISYVG